MEDLTKVCVVKIFNWSTDGEQLYWQQYALREVCASTCWVLWARLFCCCYVIILVCTDKVVIRLMVVHWPRLSLLPFIEDIWGLLFCTIQMCSLFLIGALPLDPSRGLSRCMLSVLSLLPFWVRSISLCAAYEPAVCVVCGHHSHLQSSNWTSDLFNTYCCIFNLN